jgi:hypothetical protein
LTIGDNSFQPAGQDCGRAYESGDSKHEHPRDVQLRDQDLGRAAVPRAEDGTKLVRASVTATYSGDIAGESTLEYLMYYGAASVSFIGLERITGQLGGRAGSFVLEHKGVYADGEAQGVFTVVDGSGAGDLRGLRGTGNLGAQHGPAGNVTLNYDFA